MRKPKLQIIVLFQNLGDNRTYFARSPAPPLSGILLAAETPDIVEVEVLHEMVRPIDYNTDADFIALSFMDYCSPHAFAVAREFKRRGKTVVAGGRYATNFPDEVRPHFDAIVVGESEHVWPQVVHDLVNGTLKREYVAPFSPSLEGIPAPRYDLVEPHFPMPIVTEATRGCPFHCSFCQLTIAQAPFRHRPIQDVINDLTATQNLAPWKRKMAMLLDNNLCGDLEYAKDLLREIAKLKLWALGVQFSFNYLRDNECMDLLEAANCRMAFIGLESLNEPSLKFVDKLHNRVDEYQERFTELRRRGILTFTGIILALDEDTPEYYAQLPGKLEIVDPSAILVSLAIPIPGTPLHEQMEDEGRIFNHELQHYEGDHLVFEPKIVTEQEVFDGYRHITTNFYSWRSIIRRWWRFVRDYLGNGKASNHLFGALVTSYILLKLSLFQRHHTKERISGNRKFRSLQPAVRPVRKGSVVEDAGAVEDDTKVADVAYA
jgi:radical SAM superfamily enzyme YgiQ (UPF0313 family)